MYEGKKDLNTLSAIPLNTLNSARAAAFLSSPPRSYSTYGRLKLRDLSTDHYGVYGDLRQL
jgi:hypothetical protein